VHTSFDILISSGNSPRTSDDVAGLVNITADMLSRVKTMNSVMSYETLAKSQQEDQELKTYLNQEKGLQLTPVKIPGSELYTPFGAT